MKQQKMLNTNKGITLIALVITIIVMLILVAVTISMAVNGGLFEYAGRATGETNNAIREEQGLASGKVTIDNTVYNSIDEYVQTTGGGGKTLPTYSKANKKDGYLTEKATYSDGVEEKPAIIPAGYKVLNDGEKIANGIVIADSNGNEFVWIPVEKAIVTEAEIAQIKTKSGNAEMSNKDAVQSLVTSGIFPMAVKEGKNYKGLLYEFSGTDTLTATVYDWTSTSSYREPAVLSSYDTQANFETYGLGEYSYDLYQKAYNKMVRSVAENGGFYVGRYEISSGTYTLENGSTVTYAQSKPNQTVLSTTEWYNMYKYERDYAAYNTNLGVTSEMIWGSQWDQMMLFVNGKNDGATTPAPFYVTTHGSRKTGTTSSTLTGNNAVDKVANIFDLEASRFEWTQETDSCDNRVCRGGYYSGSLRASNRDISDPTNSNIYVISSRATLYIK